MCFDHDSRPPIAPIAGGALDSRRLVLTARRRQPAARVRGPADDADRAPAIVILPDVRGLHPYYEELALRFAEHGDRRARDRLVRADRRRRAAPRRRSSTAPHVDQTTWAGIAADIRAGADALRSGRREAGAHAASRSASASAAGCRSSRATLGLGLAGAIGFYGSPVGTHRQRRARRRSTSPARCAAPVLGLFGGADEGIPAEAIAAFEDALTAAGVDHRLITYPGAPHSFFDRKAAEFAEASAAAWDETLRFVLEGGRPDA